MKTAHTYLHLTRFARLIRLFSFIALTLNLPTAYADTIPTVPDDEQPVDVQADTLHAQEEIGTSVYGGDVTLTQGSLLITGDKITLEHPNRKLKKATVLGHQAFFKRYSVDDQRWINGTANIIIYNPDSKEITFEGNATVTQVGKSSISAPYIYYDMNKKILSARSTLTEKKRVRMTFAPEKKAAP